MWLGECVWGFERRLSERSRGGLSSSDRCEAIREVSQTGPSELKAIHRRHLGTPDLDESQNKTTVSRLGLIKRKAQLGAIFCKGQRLICYTHVQKRNGRLPRHFRIGRVPGDPEEPREAALEGARQLPR